MVIFELEHEQRATFNGLDFPGGYSLSYCIDGTFKGKKVAAGAVLFSYGINDSIISAYIYSYK
jgi:hypothetical protein